MEFPGGPAVDQGANNAVTVEIRGIVGDDTPARAIESMPVPKQVSDRSIIETADINSCCTNGARSAQCRNP